jgi:hypothetical protein
MISTPPLMKGHMDNSKTTFYALYNTVFIVLVFRLIIVEKCRAAAKANVPRDRAVTDRGEGYQINNRW